MSIMITVICGEDTISSREYFTQQIAALKEKSFDVVYVTPQELEEKTKDEESAPTLFDTHQAYAVVGLNAYVKKYSSSKLPTQLANFEKKKNDHIIDWEDGVISRDIKLKVGTVKEFKVSENIFKLADALYPKNLSYASRTLSTLGLTQGTSFILFMIMRHIRRLLLVEGGARIVGLADWQRGRLRQQVGRWRREDLISFYRALIRLDISSKTGTNPLSPMKTLEAVFCYYLA